MAEREDAKNQAQQDARETAAIIKESLLSISASISKSIKESVTDAFDNVSADTVKLAGKEIAGSFRSAIKFSDNIAANTFKIKEGLSGSSDIQKQIESVMIAQEDLLVKEDILRRAIGDLTDDQVKALEDAKNLNQEILEKLQEQKKTTEDIEKNMGTTGEIFKRLSKNKFFGSILNAEAGLKAMRKEAAKGTTGFKLMGKGISAAFKGIEKGTIILAAISAAIKAIKFVVDLFVSAQERTVAIAKQLNISRDAAENIRQDFVEIASSSSNILVNSKSLVEAQGNLVENLGASVKFSSELLESQVFLTKNLGLSGEVAAQFNNMLGATGQSAEGVTKNIIGLNNEFALSNGYAVPFSSIMDEISKTSSEVAGYFGFSAENMAKGVLQVRKFGLNLEQATSVAKSLLDFESSIGSELEAELLTGKEFNFERARTLAMTGDVSGATQEVLKQMQSLTKEQRKSPIIMESIAKSTGLSVSEINKAFLTQERLNMQTKQYNELLARGGKIGQQNAVEQLALEGATYEEIKKTLTIQESYGAALEKAKDSFSGLVNSGVINDLSDVLIKAVQILGDLLGTSLSTEQKNQAKALTETGLTERQARKTVKAAEGPGFFDYLGVGTSPMGMSNLMSKKLTARAAKEQIKAAQLKQPKETELATGGIVQSPTRALVGEAGAEAVVPLNQFYAKMDEMIAAIREGGDVFIDGNKAGMALNLGAYRSSTA